jgi:hypothetical protein
VRNTAERRTMLGMRTSTPVGGSREFFADQRGASRLLRLSWHPEHRMFVFSLWSGRECLASFRLSAGDVPGLVHVLTTGLADPAAASHATSTRCQAILGAPARTAPGAEVCRRIDKQARAALTRALDGMATGCTRLRTHLARGPGSPSA